MKLYKEGKCKFIISIALDVRVTYPKRSVGSLKGVMRLLRSLPTLIAIPTTAGTGSEITPAAIITDSERKHKYALMSFPLIPHYAVLDAEFTYSPPMHLASTTGMDALTHAVQANIGRSTHLIQEDLLLKLPSCLLML